MNEEVKNYISDILDLLNNPMGGSNKIVPTEEQINELNEQTTVQDAIGITALWGWTDYNEIWLKENQTEQVDIKEIVRQALSGQDTSPFIGGLSSGYPITYEGKPTTIGQYEENFYTIGDNTFGFEALAPDAIMELQAELINAGLLGPAVGKSFRPGVWQPLVEGKVMYNLMAEANMLSLGQAEDGWENVLQSYIDNPVSTEFEPEPYLPPDYRSVSNSIDGLFENDLGRKPKPYELKLLAETYLNESLSAYKQDVELGKPVQETVTPEMLADYGNHLQEPEIREETDIDPSAALLDVFDRITKTEQERLGKNRDIQAGNNLILNSIGGLERL